MGGASGLRQPAAVLHVVGALERGGVETWLLDLAARLDRSRWRFDFCELARRPGRLGSLAGASGSRVVACPVATPSRWSFPLRLHRLLRESGYDIVHSHVHGFSGVVLAAAAAAGVRVRVAHSHNTSDGHADTWRRRCYRFVSGAVLERSSTAGLACSAEAARALFGGAWSGLPRISLMHYGLNGSLEPRQPDPDLRPRLGLPPGAAVAGHVGRFELQKNHEFLMEVAAAARRLRPDLRWLLVGDGVDRARIEKRAGRLGLADRVLFAGLREDVAALMCSAMDVFVLPSRHEGLPLVLLEAQAAGLRSVASDRITREAAVVEGAVEFERLEAGAEVWARRVVASLDAGRVARETARAQLLAGGFSIEESLGRLLEFYEAAAAGGEARE